jgi:hypothetical protein
VAIRWAIWWRSGGDQMANKEAIRWRSIRTPTLTLTLTLTPTVTLTLALALTSYSDDLQL